MILKADAEADAAPAEVHSAVTEASPANIPWASMSLVYFGIFTMDLPWIYHGFTMDLPTNVWVIL